MRKSKGLSYALSILFIVLLGIVITTMILILMNKKLTQKKESDLSIIVDEISYAKCSAYCLSCFAEDCSCSVNKKEVPCSFFTDTANLINKLNEMEFNYESPLPYNTVSSIPRKCKLADIVGISSSVKSSIEKNVKDKAIVRYKEFVERYAEEYSLPPCLLFTTIAVESSGGDEKITYRNGKAVSCGITMITPETYRMLTGESCDDKECCEKLKNDDELSIKLAARYFVSSLTRIKEITSTYSYPQDDILFLAYVFAYYNGGSKALSPSRDCSLDNCIDLKESLENEFDNVKNVPAFMCSYNSGEYGKETQPHVKKALYAYYYCNEVLR